MDNIINKIMIGLLPTSYFLWTNQFTGACIVLFLLMVLDGITGVRKAKQQKNFSSTIAREKTKKKALDYLTILLVGYLINMFFINTSIDGLVAEFMISLIGGFIHSAFIIFAGFLIGVEGYSILENLAQMGVPIPKKIIKDWSNNIK